MKLQNHTTIEKIYKIYSSYLELQKFSLHQQSKFTKLKIHSKFQTKKPSTFKTGSSSKQVGFPKHLGSSYWCEDWSTCSWIWTQTSESSTWLNLSGEKGVWPLSLLSSPLSPQSEIKWMFRNKQIKFSFEHSKKSKHH